MKKSIYSSPQERLGPCSSSCATARDCRNVSCRTFWTSRNRLSAGMNRVNGGSTCWNFAKFAPAVGTTLLEFVKRFEKALHDRGPGIRQSAEGVWRMCVLSARKSAMSKRVGVKGDNWATCPDQDSDAGRGYSGTEALGLRSDHLVSPQAVPTAFGKELLGYFAYRGGSQSLCATAVDERRSGADLFEKLRRKYKSARTWCRSTNRARRRRSRLTSPAFLTCSLKPMRTVCPATMTRVSRPP